jgi:hypothetical protein
MGSLNLLAIGLGGIAAAFALFVLLPKLFMLGLRDSLEGRVKHRYADASQVLFVEYSANSYGVLSKGATQWRGNGALVITKSELCFFQFLLERPLTLPLSRITGLSLVHKHLGKATLMQLLRVDFETKTGRDAIAFWVPKPEELKGLIDEARRAMLA